MPDRFGNKPIIAIHKSNIDCLGNWRLMKKGIIEYECDRCGKKIMVMNYIEGDKNLPEELRLENINQEVLK